MPIFQLKKYVNKETTNPQDTANDQNAEKVTEQEEKTITIQVSDTIADVIAKTLYEKYGNVEKKEEGENNNVDVAVVSTEDINKDMVEVYRKYKAENIFIYLNKEKFNTIAEEWYLENNKNKNLIFTTNSFMNLIEKL